MPAVYLEQGERLRCVASRGYCALHDGIPPEAGPRRPGVPLGQPSSRSPTSPRTTSTSRSASAVKAEICVPLTLGSRVIGVLNVESLTPIGRAPPREVERCAALLVRRLADLGPLDDADPRPAPGPRRRPRRRRSRTRTR